MRMAAVGMATELSHFRRVAQSCPPWFDNSINLRLPFHPRLVPLSRSPLVTRTARRNLPEVGIEDPMPRLCLHRDSGEIRAIPRYVCVCVRHNVGHRCRGV